MFGVSVAINLPVKSLFKKFTYAVPDRLNFIDIGWRVIVPFGQQVVEGFVVEITALPKDKIKLSKIKNIEAVLGDEPWFDEEMLAVARWLAQYYMCSLAEVMRLFIPGKTSIKRTPIHDENGNFLYYTYEQRLKEKNFLAYLITDLGKQALVNHNISKRAVKQKQALEVLAQSTSPLTFNELEVLGIGKSALNALLDNKMIVKTFKRVLRNSYARLVKRSEYLTLTNEQQVAIEKINLATDNKEAQTFLLQGITGSGKTEVYLRTAAHIVEQGKQVLMLVPEIALTPQLVRRFQAWFGGNIAVAHSKLSQNERGDVWYKMRTGQAQILIGVRSAVFAPFKNLGLIIIDEEHESSYKQEERPNYHAREVALTRSRYLQIPVVLGSATPDLCTYYKAINNEYTHLRLTQRPNGSKLPVVEIVDMRQELAEKNYSVLSRALQQALVTTCADGEQAIILLNRRGYSTFVMCRDCGQTITCPHCAVALVYHSANEDMRCHYCGNTAHIPSECPICHSKRIKFFGTGTQKAELELEKLPEVQVLRMDQDSTANKFAHEDILKQFAEKKRNVLIGTQMVAKGHDIPNVTLVGVLSADSSLNLPDYRASERAFSLLTQAAGRAGRGDKIGHVIFQTYDVENSVLQLAARQDYDSFAQNELMQRKEFFYPPFSQILKITVWHKDEAIGLALAQKVVFYLQGLQLQNLLTDVKIAGPFPAMIAKVRDLYRFNILIKAKDMHIVKQALLKSEFKEQPNIFFDIDPNNVV